MLSTVAETRRRSDNRNLYALNCPRSLDCTCRLRYLEDVMEWLLFLAQASRSLKGLASKPGRSFKAVHNVGYGRTMIAERSQSFSITKYACQVKVKRGPVFFLSS